MHTLPSLSLSQLERAQPIIPDAASGLLACHTQDGRLSELDLFAGLQFLKHDDLVKKKVGSPTTQGSPPEQG